MTDRLTDEELTQLESPMEVVFGELERMVPLAIAELRTLRTRPAEPQGLTKEEREALGRLVEECRTWRQISGHFTHHHRDALAVLDRLLNRGDE